MVHHGPRRTCVGCRTTRSWNHVVRFCCDDDGMVRPSPVSRGRGAWICADTLSTCLERAMAAKAFSRAFRRPIAGVDLAD